MNLAQILAALAQGHTVYWSNPGYVVRGKHPDLCITYTPNGHTVGLTDDYFPFGDPTQPSKDFHILA